MPIYKILWTSEGEICRGDKHECEDFREAAEYGLQVANNDGLRLLEISDITDTDDHEGMDLLETDGGPKIGIFWRVQPSGGDACLLMDYVPIARAEPYGEFLNYGSHYDYWTKLAAVSARERGMCRWISEIYRWTEYEEWPRGRIVFHQLTGRFILYADRKLQTPDIIGEIMQRFSLPADRTDVRSDAHYVSVR